MLKWEMNIRKPQGLWRPKLTIKIWAEDSEKVNDLNIDSDFDLRNLHWAKNLTFSKCDTYGISCAKCVDDFPLKFYRYADIKKSDRTCMKKVLNLYDDKLEYYIEFRSEPIPDYSDYINWFRDNVLIPAKNELINRIRLGESLQKIDETISAESEELLDFYKTENHKIYRKLKTI